MNKLDQRNFQKTYANIHKKTLTKARSIATQELGRTATIKHTIDKALNCYIEHTSNDIKISLPQVDNLIAEVNTLIKTNNKFIEEINKDRTITKGVKQWIKEQ